MSSPYTNSAARTGRTNRVRWAYIGMGCGGLAILVLAAFAVFFLAGTYYRPHIAPARPLPIPNAFDDYVSICERFRQLGGLRSLYSNNGTGQIIPSQMPSVVQMHQGTLAQIRAAFRKDCRVPALRSFQTLLAYLPTSRKVVRLFCVEAQVKAARGDYAGGVQSCLDAIEFAFDLKRGGELIHANFAASCVATAEIPLAEWVDRLTETECSAAADRLEALLQSEYSNVEVMRETKNARLAGLLEIDRAVVNGDLRGVTSLWPNSSVIDYRLGPFKMRSALNPLIWRMFRGSAFRESEQRFEGLIRNAGVPALSRKPLINPQSPLSAIFCPDYSGYLAKADIPIARNRLLLCAMRIRCFFLRNNRLPFSLSELRIPVRLTNDPYTGSELVYRARDRDYLLYSVGFDGIDNGGEPVDEAGARASGDLGMRRFDRRTVPPMQETDLYVCCRPVPHMELPKVP